MDRVSRNLVGTEFLVFIADVFLFSKSAEENSLRLDIVLRRFDEANLRLHPKNCVFAQPNLKFVFSEIRVSASIDKLNAVWEFRKPTNVRDIRALLDLSTTYIILSNIML